MRYSISAVMLLFCAAAWAHDPCDHQGRTAITFASGAAAVEGGVNAEALRNVASSWATRHSILTIESAAAEGDPALAAGREAAVKAALVQLGVGKHWLRTKTGEAGTADLVTIAAPDAGLGCLGVPGRYTAQ